MLSLLVAHIIITAVCLWSGFLFYKLFQRNDSTQPPLVYYAISGLITLTMLAQIVVLIFPINAYVQLVVAAVLLLSILLQWKNFKDLYERILSEFRSWPVLSSVLFLIAWLIILLINAGPTMMDDTESYHIQSIKWIQEYGTVPGLVNLHERFGFNSSWFSSSALFSFSPKTTGGFAVLNGVLSMWLCYWCISKYNQFQKENNSRAVVTILMIFITALVVWPLLRGNAATTNYDFITTCIVLILFTEIFFSKEFSPSIEWIIWPVYLFTIRIINFPLLLLSLPAFLFFIKHKKIKSLFLPGAYCLLLIVPFLIRNVIIAGYPFYPSAYFDVVSVDWKPDPQITERLLEYIKYYNRVSTTYLEIEQTKALGANWVTAWFSHLFFFDKILVVFGIAGIIATVVKLLSGKNRNKSILLMTVIIVWLACWFLISPDPRFVYGILLFGIFLFVYHILSIIKNTTAVKTASGALIILMIAGAMFYFFSKPWRQKEYRNWIMPAQLPQPPVKEIVVDGIIFYVPEKINNNWNARCYGTDLPCVYKVDPRLKPRGKNIRSGFHLEK